LEAEVLERFGSQPAGDPASLAGPVPDGFAELVELLTQVGGDRGRQSLHLKQDSGQRLTDLIVKLPSDTAALGLLQRCPRSGRPGMSVTTFQSVRHVAVALPSSTSRGDVADPDFTSVTRTRRRLPFGCVTWT
jgi:hypothetical protein